MLFHSSKIKNYFDIFVIRNNDEMEIPSTEDMSENNSAIPPQSFFQEHNAIRLISAERRRKAEKYGWDTNAIIDRIDDYGNGELPAAAACYCIPTLANEYFPWDLSYFKPTLDDPTIEERITELTKAGAFIVDEIIRLQHLSLTP